MALVIANKIGSANVRPDIVTWTNSSAFDSVIVRIQHELCWNNILCKDFLSVVDIMDECVQGFRSLFEPFAYDSPLLAGYCSWNDVERPKSVDVVAFRIY